MLPEPPDPLDRGLLTGNPDDLARRTVRAWTLFAELLPEVDLDGPSRSSHRSAREIVIGLGTWPTSRGIPELLADARAGATRTEPFTAESRRLAIEHAGATDEEIVQSVRDSLTQTQAWLELPGALETDGKLPTPSPLGPLPMGTVLHSAVFQLALSARDLIPAGAPEVPELDDLGLAALLDATGAVAGRLSLTSQAVAVTERFSVASRVAAGGWQTQFDSGLESPAIHAPAELLLDLAGGRVAFGAMSRQLRFTDARGFLALAPVVDELPDLPGGPILKRLARFARFLSR